MISLNHLLKPKGPSGGDIWGLFRERYGIELFLSIYFEVVFETKRLFLLRKGRCTGEFVLQ